MRSGLRDSDLIGCTRGRGTATCWKIGANWCEESGRSPRSSRINSKGNIMFARWKGDSARGTPCRGFSEFCQGQAGMGGCRGAAGRAVATAEGRASKEECGSRNFGEQWEGLRTEREVRRGHDISCPYDSAGESATSAIQGSRRRTATLSTSARCAMNRSTSRASCCCLECWRKIWAT